jgi:hypothetical protein
MPQGYDREPYILPLDHRSSFQARIEFLVPSENWQESGGHVEKPVASLLLEEQGERSVALVAQQPASQALRSSGTKHRAAALADIRARTTAAVAQS